MKYTQLIPAIALMLIAVSACKKKDNDDSSAKTKMLYGSWKWTFVVEDANNNNVMDSDEYTEITEGYRLNFAKGGTGDGSCGTDTACTPFTFTWALKDGETSLQMITPGSPSLDTSYLPLTTFTSDKFIYSVGDTNLFWVVYEKQ